MKKLLIFYLFLSSIVLWSEEQGLAQVNNIDIWWEGYGDQKNPPVLLIMGPVSYTHLTLPTKA